jgi:hypothetical protein
MYRMHFYFDESGDYAFPEGEFDCYVQAALICPDDALAEVDQFVNDRREEWGVDELHTTELDPSQRLEVAKFIGGSNCHLLAHVTDTTLITKTQLEEFRLAQAATLKRNLDWYQRESTKTLGAPVKKIENWYDRALKRTGLSSQISHGEFIQASFLIGLILEAFRKSLIVFHQDQWRESFHDFHFILDGKLPGKMAAGEKFLNDSLVPALGSMKGQSIITVDTWREKPVHPFVEKFSTEKGRIRGEDVGEAIDLKRIFEHGLRFESSDKESGLQLVDAVAYLVRRAAMEPNDELAQEAYDAIRDKLRNGEGRCLTIQRLNVGQEDRSSLERYRQLYSPSYT